MNKESMASKDPDIIGSYAALRRVAKRALQIGLETGTPVYVLIDGKIVDLTKRYQRKIEKREVIGRGGAPYTYLGGQRQMCMRIDYLFEENLRNCIDFYGDDTDYSGPVEQMRNITLRNIRCTDVERIVRPFLLKWGKMQRVVCQVDQWEHRIADSIVSKANLLEQLRERKLEDHEIDLAEYKVDIEELYASFKEVVRQTAAAKILHLICPDFMPMWDTLIEQGFRAEYNARVERDKHVKSFSDVEYFLYVQEVQRVLRTYSEPIERVSARYNRSKLRLLDQCFIWAVRRPLFSFLNAGL